MRVFRFCANDAVGFYKDSSNDYKLVYFVSGGSLGAYIYSHRLDSWREIQFPFATVSSWSAATLCGQCLYFTVTWFPHWWIISFHVESELSKQRELWRMDGDGDGWVKVAALSDPLDGVFTRQHICTSSFRNWVVVLDHKNKSLKKVNMEDFTTRYPCFCSPMGWNLRSSRVIYVETLVSPLNP
ncbi:hypothetical protein HanRHA438_Chr08g0359351 [Helianthus annuus]|nr:hypothetical protein HanIR_Chr08g0374571 [Helianthus annuus]KAJ0554187.1 hypothetical protein HanHA89_Chr08g0304841 [Helianthus annuus]KAJ0719791.1 hypothetical protein HanLR1_Chr08g0285681 [Helianthus annuus]KAJ0723017.1 hypothetical protein HanOQP8_Chr08g0293191 [Helianthus annuus]KAJ0898663.1 hypothetical protein HanRHA438_Chr08g0359351 [Helianthus annuus]